MQNQIIAPHAEIQQWKDYADEVREDLRIMRNVAKGAAQANWSGYSSSNRRFILSEVDYLQAKLIEANEKVLALLDA